MLEKDRAGKAEKNRRRKWEEGGRGDTEWRERKMGRSEKGVGQRREAEREKGKKISFYGLYSSQSTLFKKN